MLEMRLLALVKVSGLPQQSFLPHRDGIPSLNGRWTPVSRNGLGDAVMALSQASRWVLSSHTLRPEETVENRNS